MLCAALAILPGAREAAASNPNCGSADPSGELAGISGDFELSEDPADPQGRMLFLSNVIGGSTAPQNVVVARIDGTTGQVIAGSLTVIASNFEGNSNQNGPSWMQTPTGQLGILYVGRDGVHGAFRGTQPSTWNGFRYDYSGAPTYGVPPALPDTVPGFYPGNPLQPPVGAATIPQYQPPCISVCYGAYNKGVTTDMVEVVRGMGFYVSGVTQTPWDGDLYVSACVTNPRNCGIYLARIDGMGGLSRFRHLIAIGSTGSRSMAAVQHPVTGATLLFTDETDGKISIWQQKGNDMPMEAVGRVAVVEPADHFRAGTSDTQVVLNYLVRSGDQAGSYTIPIGSDGGTLQIGKSKQISTRSSGTEFDWFPAAHQWAIVYRAEEQYQRCWVTP